MDDVILHGQSPERRNAIPWIRLGDEGAQERLRGHNEAMRAALDEPVAPYAAQVESRGPESSCLPAIADLRLW
jgi:hypothetical protein